MPDIFLRPGAANASDIILYDPMIFTAIFVPEYPVLLELFEKPTSSPACRLLVRRRVFGSARYEEVWGDAPPIAYIVYKGKGKE